jgi:hypothetical protein
MIEALVLAVGLATRTQSPSPVRRQQRVLVSPFGLSETPLPEGLGPTALRQVPTLGTSTADRRSILSQVEAIQKHKDAVSVLRINDEDEAFVSQIIAENRPKATTKRLLTRPR